MTIVSRIAMVKADKARAVEDLLIRMAQGGQVRAKITEKQLIELLEQVNQQTKSETKIVVRILYFMSNRGVFFLVKK
jgi:programmed cell death protein 5